MAMTLLSVVLLSLAKMSYVLSKRSRENDLFAKRNAVLMQESNKFGAMRFDSLGTISTADKTLSGGGGFSYTRKLTITSSGTDKKTVKIVVVPALNTAKKDSVILYRSKPAGSPLCVGC